MGGIIPRACCVHLPSLRQFFSRGLFVFHAVSRCSRRGVRSKRCAALRRVHGACAVRLVAGSLFRDGRGSDVPPIIRDGADSACARRRDRGDGGRPDTSLRGGRHVLAGGGDNPFRARGRAVRASSSPDLARRRAGGDVLNTALANASGITSILRSCCFGHRVGFSAWLSSAGRCRCQDWRRADGHASRQALLHMSFKIFTSCSTPAKWSPYFSDQDLAPENRPPQQGGTYRTPVPQRELCC